MRNISFSFYRRKRERKKEIEVKKKWTGYSETLVRVYQTTRRHVPEVSDLVPVFGNDVRNCAYAFFVVYFSRLGSEDTESALGVGGGWRGRLIDVDNDFMCLFFIGTAQSPERAFSFLLTWVPKNRRLIVKWTK
jgi:hypothetical protein